jgi:hypothetical protein
MKPSQKGKLPSNYEVLVADEARKKGSKFYFLTKSWVGRPTIKSWVVEWLQCDDEISLEKFLREKSRNYTKPKPESPTIEARHVYSPARGRDGKVYSKHTF